MRQAVCDVFDTFISTCSIDAELVVFQGQRLKCFRIMYMLGLQFSILQYSQDRIAACHGIKTWKSTRDRRDSKRSKRLEEIRRDRRDRRDSKRFEDPKAATTTQFLTSDARHCHLPLWPLWPASFVWATPLMTFTPSMLQPGPGEQLGVSSFETSTSSVIDA